CEAVHRVPTGVGPAIERPEQPIVPAWVEHLHFDEHLEHAEHLQRLCQGRDQFAIGERHRGQVAPPRLRDRQSEYGGVVMDDDLAVDRRVDVELDRKSTRLNSSHVAISYAVFCLKKKTYRYF